MSENQMYVLCRVTSVINRNDKPYFCHLVLGICHFSKYKQLQMLSYKHSCSLQIQNFTTQLFYKIYITATCIRMCQVVLRAKHNDITLITEYTCSSITYLSSGFSNIFACKLYFVLIVRFFTRLQINFHCLMLSTVPRLFSLDYFLMTRNDTE